MNLTDSRLRSHNTSRHTLLDGSTPSRRPIAMSFFGIQTVVKDDKPSVYDFDDTYNEDALAAQLDDANDDALNDETFGDIGPVGKDFDFAQQTASVAGAIDEEQFTYARNQPAPSMTGVSQSMSRMSLGGQQPAIPKLQPIASLWETPQQQQQPQQPQQPRALSLEEVEAQLRAQQGRPAPGVGPGPGPGPVPVPGPGPMGHMGGPMGMMPGFPSGMPGMPPMGMQMPGGFRGPYDPSLFPPMGQGMPMPQNFAGMQGVQGGPGMGQQFPPTSQGGPDPSAPSAAAGQAAGPAGPGPVQSGDKPWSQTAPQAASSVPSLDQVRSEEMGAVAIEQERLLHRSREIAGMAKYNGLMSQRDKSLILRIQLQHMVTNDPYNEDFYYQVHSVIQARSNPSQPLNDFAKTYLFQRGQRQGRNRRHDQNPLQRMQQQVQEAVAHAKDHPKKEHVKPEGALGKISVSGSRPRRTLEIKMLQLDPHKAAAQHDVKYTARHLLSAIESVYAILLDIESKERGRAREVEEAGGNDDEWRAEMHALVERLWTHLEVLAPVDADGNQPFVMMLRHDKAMKVIPRIFRHLDQKQRLTMLTRIVAHIDSLDVVRDGAYVDDNDLRAKARESVELFSQTVLPSLVHFVSESAYDVIVGLLEILLNSKDIVHVAKTKIGLALLTVLISRAELLNQDEGVDSQDQHNWQQTFNVLFSRLQGHLSSLFPPRTVDNSYVWHFLASLALAAKLEHQRVMVDEVRDRIFGTMAEAKSLPPELSAQKIANLNLFLNVMGLNATATDITELQTSE